MRELRDFPEVLDAVGVRDAVLVGHSDGGSIANVFAGSGLPLAHSPHRDHPDAVVDAVRRFVRA
jgi:pimeloyl-ACP methyl ester carboxylesterase